MGCCYLVMSPRYSHTNIKLIPSSTLKRSISRVNQEAVQQDTSVHTVAYSTFHQIWRKLLLSLLMMKPVTKIYAGFARRSVLPSYKLPTAQTVKSPVWLKNIFGWYSVRGHTTKPHSTFLLMFFDLLSLIGE